MIHIEHYYNYIPLQNCDDDTEESNTKVVEISKINDKCTNNDIICEILENNKNLFVKIIFSLMVFLPLFKLLFANKNYQSHIEYSLKEVKILNRLQIIFLLFLELIILIYVEHLFFKIFLVLINNAYLTICLFLYSGLTLKKLGINY